MLVLGAGPAGLAFASRYGRGSIVLEKSGEVGGLSRSIRIHDGVFDVGGHSFHTPHPEVLELVRSLMNGSWHEHPRDARVWVSGQLIPYPFQSHFEHLDDKSVVADCRGHVADVASVAASAHFEEWIRRRFGDGIADHFMLPYNRKLWACDLGEMSREWVGERVATERDDRGRVGSGARTRQPLQSDSLVGYPAQGGFGAIFDALARRCERIELGESVIRVDMVGRVVHTAAGHVWPYDAVVSTLPMPQLANAIDGCPARVVELASRLRAVSLKVVLILARLADRNVPQRIYIADPAVPAHKIAFNHTSSPSLAARKNHAIVCEVAYSHSKPARPDAELLDASVDWLVANRFIASSRDVVARKVLDVPYGYPIPTHSRPAIVAEIGTFLERSRIHSIGRFGAWTYANSDECMRQGLELALRLSQSGSP